MAPPPRKKRKKRVLVTVEQSDAACKHSAGLLGLPAAASAAPTPAAPAQRGGGFVPPALPPTFEDYYRRQGIVPPGEWPQFATALGCELPCSFRVSPGSTDTTRALLESDALDTDESPPSVEPVPWLAPGYAYVVRTATGGGRQGLRRRAPCFHRWLTAEHESGRLTRQELVSMVPPLVLAPQRGDCVLDMCASPGSKTAQLLHALVGSAEDYDPAAGVVVANDAEAKRCSILTHQLRRYGPAASTALLVTHHDAAHDPPPAPTGGYDKILCDVPCSGDGTMRKNGSIATAWSATNGLGRHALQLQILRQGLARLKVGGRLVYSTCSLNPHENEAVVCAALTTADGCGGGGVVLEDCSAEMPALRRLPGLETWGVLLPNEAAQSDVLPPNEAAQSDVTCAVSMSEDRRRAQQRGQWFKSYADVPPALASSLSLPPSVFPPDPAVVASLGLQHVWRLLPHHQDTGGFFVCAFRRIAPAPQLSGGIPRPIGLARPSRKQRKKQKRVAATATLRGDSGSITAGTSADACVSTWLPLKAPDLPAFQAATEFFQLEPTNAAAVTRGCLFRRGDSVHLLTNAAAALANGSSLNMVSCGSTILENGIGKKKAIELQLQATAGTTPVDLVSGTTPAVALLGPGGGYVIPQAALSLALRWITHNKAKEQREEVETPKLHQDNARKNRNGKAKSSRVLVLSRQAMLSLLEAKRSGAHGGKLKCAPAEPPGTARCADTAVLHEALITQVGKLEPGGCIAVCKEESQLSRAKDPSYSQSYQPVALSCWKSDPYWLQISSNDKAALALVAERLGGTESIQAAAQRSP